MIVNNDPQFPVYLIAFYQRIVELLCHAKNFPNALCILFVKNIKYLCFTYGHVI